MVFSDIYLNYPIILSDAAGAHVVAHRMLLPLPLDVYEARTG